MEWEFWILHFLQELHTPWLDELMVRITHLADHGEIWIFLGICMLFFRKTRKVGIGVLLSIVLSFLIGNLILKNLFARQRPCWMETGVLLLIENPTDFSFPSGHTLVSFTSAVSIFLQNRKWGTAALAFAAVIAFSRLYLFVHFPTDILGGILLGSADAYFVWKVLERKSRKTGKA